MSFWIRITTFFGGGSSWHGRSTVSLDDAFDKAAKKSGKQGWFVIDTIKVKRENPITEYFVLLSDTTDPPP